MTLVEDAGKKLRPNFLNVDLVCIFGDFVVDVVVRVERLKKVAPGGGGVL